MRARSLAVLGLASTAVLAAAGMVAVTVTVPGCGSCDICPATTVIVASTTNADLDIRNLFWAGPACPSANPECRGDDMTTTCTHVSITAAAPGECALVITFGDRPAEVVHAEFGTQAPSQKCCGGFPVIGDQFFTIPANPDGGSIYGGDGDTDAVSFLPDGGAADASDAADAADGGAPADDAASDGGASPAMPDGA
jgi:hypothetical protein